MSDQESYVFVCDSTDVEVSSEAVFEINDREILVVRSNEGELFAVEDNCPHANECLSGGRLRNGFYNKQKYFVKIAGPRLRNY